MINEIAFSEDLTMGSHSLFQVINHYRKAAGEPEIKYAKFRAKMESELDDLAGFQKSTLRISRNNGGSQEVDSWELPKDDCMYVAMRESKAVRRQVVERLNKLEAGLKEIADGTEEPGEMAAATLSPDYGKQLLVSKRPYEVYKNFDGNVLEVTARVLGEIQGKWCTPAQRDRVLKSLNNYQKTAWQHALYGGPTAGEMATLTATFTAAEALLVQKQKTIHKGRESRLRTTVGELESVIEDMELRMASEIGELEETIDDLEVQLAGTVDTRPTMEIFIPIHSYTVNQMYEHDGSRNPKGKRRTKGYNNWRRDFHKAVRHAQIVNNGVNTNGLLEVHYEFGALKGYDWDNLVKSAQDRVFDEVLHRGNDNNVIKGSGEKVIVSDWDEGYIRVTIKNVAM